MDDLSGTLDERGNTVLHVAAEHGHLECVQRLVALSDSQMILLPNDEILTATGLAVKVREHVLRQLWFYN